MKRSVICILALCMMVAMFTGCSNKKEVKIIQNTPPSDKKTVVEKPEDKTPVPTASGTPIYVEFGDASMTVYDDIYKNTVIPYEEAEIRTYSQSFDYSGDTLKDGTENTTLICGQMTASDGGTYFISIYKATNSVIEIEYNGKRFVFNLESNEATRECYNRLEEIVG